MRLTAVLTLALAFGCLRCNGDTTQVLCPSTPLGTTDAALKVESFVETWGALVQAAHDIDHDMLNRCRALAADLGIPATQLAPAPTADLTAPGGDTQAACAAVKREIDRIVKADLLANAHLAVVATSVKCAVDVDARLACEQRCDATVASVGHPACAPGKTFGDCGTACAGTCTGTCAGGCAGTCAGTCTGACMGNCNGTCDGTCAAKNADGTCYGACTGTCMGVCDGHCAGTCAAGACDGTCATTCAGTCAGTCPTWQPGPLCSQAATLTTSPECRINCDARTRFTALCADPTVAIAYGTTASKVQKADLDRLVVALRTNYAPLARLGFRASSLVGGAAAEYAVALQGQVDTARQVGSTALACVSQAITGASDAVMQVNVSANAATSLAASLGAAGGLLPP
jgi:hypothetical protein